MRGGRLAAPSAEWTREERLHLKTGTDQKTARKSGRPAKSGLLIGQRHGQAARRKGSLWSRSVPPSIPRDGRFARLHKPAKAIADPRRDGMQGPDREVVRPAS